MDDICRSKPIIHVASIWNNSRSYANIYNCLIFLFWILLWSRNLLQNSSVNQSNNFNGNGTATVCLSASLFLVRHSVCREFAEFSGRVKSRQFLLLFVFPFAFFPYHNWDFSSFFLTKQNLSRILFPRWDYFHYTIFLNSCWYPNRLWGHHQINVASEEIVVLDLIKKKNGYPLMLTPWKVHARSQWRQFEICSRIPKAKTCVFWVFNWFYRDN